MSGRDTCAYCGKKLSVHRAMSRPDSTICEECQKELIKRHNENDHFEQCPFCGGKDFKYVLQAPYFYGAEGVRVRCETCGSMGGYGGIRNNDWSGDKLISLFNAQTLEDGFAKANAKWNTRTPTEKGGE